MTISRAAAASFVALTAFGCRGSQSRIDAAGDAAAGGGGGIGTGHGGATVGGAAGGHGAAGGGAAGSGGASSHASRGTCNTAKHSFPATPDAGGGPCTFSLPPPDHGQTSFLLRADDGSTVPRDASRQNGWDYTDDTRQKIRLFGPACAALTTSTVHTICIEFQYL